MLLGEFKFIVTMYSFTIVALGSMSHPSSTLIVFAFNPISSEIYIFHLFVISLTRFFPFIISC